MRSPEGRDIPFCCIPMSGISASLCRMDRAGNVLVEIVMLPFAPQDYPYAHVLNVNKSTHKNMCGSKMSNTYLENDQHITH